MEVRIAKSALADLQTIKQYYLEQDVPQVGIEYVSSIIERFEIVKAHPYSGRIVPEFNQSTIRELVYPPFRIVYQYQDEFITLIRVWRSERLLVLVE
ncbi:type II toxin-antitoxin system RelE/ParE family toxin [Marinomonas lutimaris]|jgi:toxin ParE1/3/4|uniref:type II toxin-antitoxin system RelE/ParE family toxin n=1 Tax=Marinomonas lutimaris TaxID=2846746 RepID=UPI001C681123|nr:type II toxin-antitoxin system RelE/ParE family toxin [Marinomonas lutimaris]